MRHTGAEIIIKLLERYGITTIAGIPGGSNLPLYHALHKSPIRHILARHEQGACFIAQGMARSTGKPAVCFATSGPGATNVLTALADAKLDSIPIIVITGQVPTSLIGTDAFQEVDIYTMTLPITKHNYLVKRTEDLLTVIPNAFAIAQEGRPGPVLIDIPKDIQTGSAEFDAWPDIPQAHHPPGIDSITLQRIVSAINEAQRPLLYIGGGITAAGASKEIRTFARQQSIPVTSTLMGLGCFPADDPLYVGMLGMHGAQYTNHLMREIDLLLAFGVRFDDRATGNIKKFCPQARIVHIDIDPSEINKLRKADYSWVMDIRRALTHMILAGRPAQRRDWLKRVQALRKEYGTNEYPQQDHFHPANIIRRIGTTVPADTIISTDVGQHQMWVAQTYPFQHPRTLLTSGGLGTMGFGFPAAIGAALAYPEKKVVCITGDGSFLMNIQELATLAELKTNVSIIIMNNGQLGLVRQQQELFYNKDYIASRFESHTDFAAIARGFGIRSYRTRDAEQTATALKAALLEEGPCLVDIVLSVEENVFPMVPPGGANHEMIGKNS